MSFSPSTLRKSIPGSQNQLCNTFPWAVFSTNCNWKNVQPSPLGATIARLAVGDHPMLPLSPCGTQHGERLRKPCKHKGSSAGKPGAHGERWKARAGFVAVLSFARQLLQLSPWADFLIMREASQPHCIHKAISLIFGMVWSRPMNSEPGICISEEQRYNSSRCFLTSSCYSCKNAEELLKQALKKGILPVIIFRQPVSPKAQCPQVWDLLFPWCWLPNRVIILFIFNAQAKLTTYS